MVQITNGVVKYGRTVKTGDFENKRVDVELSFSITEEDNTDEVIAHVSDKAMAHAFRMLEDGGEVKALPAKTSAKAKAAPVLVKNEESEEEAKPAKAAPKKAAAKMPEVVAPKADPSAMEDEEEKQVTPKFLGKGKAPAANPASMEEDEEELEEDEGIDDLLGGGEPAKEITDKDLDAAAQRCQAQHKNAPAIRKLLAKLGVKAPSGRLIDLPQDKRQQFLDELLLIRPMA